MRLTVNGEQRESGPARTVAALVSLLGFDSRRVAVERNLGVVPRSLWSSTDLAEGDLIEIVHFVGGG